MVQSWWRVCRTCSALDNLQYAFEDIGAQSGRSTAQTFDLGINITQILGLLLLLHGCGKNNSWDSRLERLTISGESPKVRGQSRRSGVTGAKAKYIFGSTTFVRLVCTVVTPNCLVCADVCLIESRRLGDCTSCTCLFVLRQHLTAGAIYALLCIRT